MTEQYIEELVRKYAAGTATQDEVEKLMQWYTSASVNDVQWFVDDPAEKQQVYNRMLGRLKKEIVPKRPPVIQSTWLRIAAMLTIVLGLAALAIYFFKSSSDGYVTLINPPGKIQMVRLPDNSLVWLNASGTLRYAKTFKKNRKLELQGEAYFQVAHDASHPFTVNAGGIQTTVLGTSFNISAYPSDGSTSVAVISGRVNVKNGSVQLAVLTPSVQLRFDRQHQAATTSIIDTGYVLAWKKGLLHFQGETLEEIAAAIERWYGVRIIFTKPGLRSCRYYMSFYNTISLDKLFMYMSAVTPMKYKIDVAGKTITLSGDACR